MVCEKSHFWPGQGFFRTLILPTKSYKYRIYPNRTQEVLIKKTFGCVRYVWNNWTETFNNYFKTGKTELANTTDLRKEFEFLGEVSAAALQQKSRDFFQYKQQFFNKKRKSKVGRPKFKSKYGKQSFRLPNQKFRIKENKIRLEKMGWVKFDNHRQIPENSKLLSITVSEKNGKYHAAINFEYEKTVVKEDKPSIGIDIGVKVLVVTSDNVCYDNPRVGKNQAKIRYHQKLLSRKKKGSKRYAKQKRKLGLAHEKVSRQRDWYLHNISKQIADDHGDIVMETLSVSNMQCEIRNVNRALADTAIAKFQQCITYKVEDRGNKVILIDKYFPSTKTCSGCGNIKNVELTERTYNCKECGLSLCRDHNAAINILAVGVNAA